MLFFSESTEEYLTETVEDIETPFEASSEGVTDMMSEATEEWYNLRERMMRLEHTAIVSEDMDLLSEGVSDFFTKIIAFFQKMWAHLKAIVTKFWNKIMGYVATDKQFLASYKEKYSKAASKPIKGWNFIDAVAKDQVGKLVKKANGATMAVAANFNVGQVKTDEKWSKAETYDQIRAEAIGRSGSITSSAFRGEIVKSMTGNGRDAQSEFTPDKGSVISILEGGKALISNLKTMRDDIDKVYGQIIKFFKAAASKVKGNVGKEGKETTSVETHKRSVDATKDRHDSHKLGGAEYQAGTRSADFGGNRTVSSTDDSAKYYSQAAAATKQAAAIFNAVVGAGINVINQARGEARRAVIASVNGAVGTTKEDPKKSESAGFSVLDQF